MNKIINPDIQNFINQAENESIAIDLSSVPKFEIKPRTVSQHDGVYFIDTYTDKETKEVKEKAPIRLADYFRVVGYGKDENRAAHIVLEYQDDTTKRAEIFAMKQADVDTAIGWSVLRNLGIGITGNRKMREHLVTMLQDKKGKTQYAIHNTTGWKNDSYVLPSGEILTNGKSEKKNMVFVGDTSKAKEYHVSGSLKEWQENVAKYAIGNSRLMLVIGTALAAPLLRFFPTIENGGFHLFGESRDGKSTSGYVGLSVWGSRESKLSWNTTALAVVNSAYARNDNFMVLDEIGQAKFHVVANAAYSLGNGQNKSQSEKDRNQNRATINFKTLFFSTGEKPLDTYIKQGDAKLWNAGQAVRLASIPSDTGTEYKAFETIHHFTNSGVFADHLNENTARFYGIAGREWIIALQSDPDFKQRIQNHMTAFFNSLPSGFNGQIQTVMKRFALVYAAIELASEYGITGFQAAASLAPLQRCFNDWLKRNGTANNEHTQIIEQAQDFFDMFASTSRFSDLAFFGELDTTPKDHAGFKERKGDDFIYWVVYAVFKNEIAQGYEPRKAAEILARLNWLIMGKGKNGEHQKNGKHTGGKRYMQFNGSVPPDTNGQAF